MTPHEAFKLFQAIFPWIVPHVVKYIRNRSEGGIDIWLDSGEVLNFKGRRNDWVLKKTKHVGIENLAQ